MPKQQRVILCFALVMTSGFLVLSVADAQGPGAKVAAEAIQKLANDAGTKDWEALSNASSEVARKTRLEDVMNLLKLRRPGAKVVGLGVGPNPGKITPDGIEVKILSLSKKPLPEAVLAREQADLIRMAEITAAIAATASHQGPVQGNRALKDPAKWKEQTREMYESSQDLIKALKDKDTKAVRTAANRVTKSCSDCHEVFRDDK